MSENQMAAPDAPLCLSAVFDSEAAAEMKPALVAALVAGKVEIDAGQVQRVTSQGLQLLAAAANSCREREVGFRIEGPTPAFATAAQTLGLTRTLGLDGE